jgi:hypothetical protein
MGGELATIAQRAGEMGAYPRRSAGVSEYPGTVLEGRPVTDVLVVTA